MSEPEKALCPYCGAEMCVDSYFKREFGPRYFCHCWTCGSMGPDGGETEEKAREAALKRYKPMQKPLTWEEVIAHEKPYHLWVEERRASSKVYQYIFYDRYMIYADNQYGVSFRFWATKPTDAERAAAKWEDKNDA